MLASTIADPDDRFSGHKAACLQHLRSWAAHVRVVLLHPAKLLRGALAAWSACARLGRCVHCGVSSSSMWFYVYAHPHRGAQLAGADARVWGLGSGVWGLGSGVGCMLYLLLVDGTIVLAF